jgi:hypothetical protein
MLTGTVPFEAEGALATAMKHVTDRPPSPRERNPRVPKAMEALVMGLLAKDPENRGGSAFELADYLRKVRAELPPAFLAGAAGAPGTPQEQASADGGANSVEPGSKPQSSRKSPVAMGLVALLALLVLGTFGWGLTGSREGPNSVGAVAASEKGKEGGALAAPEGSGDARERTTGEGVGSALPPADLAGPYVPAASSSSSAPLSASSSASASTPASASPSASATPEAPASGPGASGPWTPAPSASASPAAAQEGPSGSGGKDPGGTTSSTAAESAAQEQYHR